MVKSSLKFMQVGLIGGKGRPIWEKGFAASEIPRCKDLSGGFFHTTGPASLNTKTTLLDIFHATPQSPQRLIPITLDNQCVASVAALRETKMSSSVHKDI
jgi:hypothetical protein